MASSRNSADRALTEALSRFVVAGGTLPTPDHPLMIALSGGLDSTVLLHSAMRVIGAGSIVAAHVDHGLQPLSKAWFEHCAAESAALGVRFVGLRALGSPARGDSIEQWARGERYRLLFKAAADVGAAALMTAHHADDQLETLLLAMARGSGLDGLTGIAESDDREGVVLLRPLLTVTQAQLAREAKRLGLRWVDDPSNLDLNFARNAVRHRLMPVLREVLPDLPGQLPATIELLRQARATLESIAEDDLRGVSSVLSASGTGLQILDRAALSRLALPRRAAVLRAWVRSLGCLPPPQARLQAMSDQLVDGAGAYGEVRHDGWQLMRYRHAIFGVRCSERICHGDAPAAFEWRGESRVSVGADSAFEFRVAAEGLSAAWLRTVPLNIAPASSGARLRLSPNRASRSMKNLWQEAGIPAWLRPRFPALWCADRLLLAAPFGLDRSQDWPIARPGIAIDWVMADVTDLRRAFMQAPAPVYPAA
ncbi:MAG: tRNA lysidine(34) synthetase TilS [Burkholderiales bacterium]|nr:tRNA lysidine(34) synthetase TilS [Burkholderiales bacterium]